ncbi:hypothetical protein GQX73_g4672 [Xylaria multiplex]|uniref:Zn(2)-C6 fungal-type domain-containing protein n=1 Tax=Xylaria multiplex TaxID=323545 RepID=A0A7C8IPF4_9PEZI|nr:hypothetical protein GQX73_g4672 [Xylaria multiplex]
MDSSISRSKRRRMHYKSRKGCLECKRRHIKCDEHRPICVNCNTTGRTCHYLPRAVVSADSSSATSTSAAASPDSIYEPVIPESALLQSTGHDHCFTLQHLVLLHHVETDMEDWLCIPARIRNLGLAYLNVALTSPFLIEQLLAVSAQHLSTVHPSLRGHYRRLSAALQTRALDGFKASAADSSRQNIMARFLFSTLIAVTTMASVAISSRHDIDKSLPGFVEFLGVTRGVRIVGDSAWAELYQSELGWIFSSFEDLEEYTEPLPTCLRGVVRMLQRPNIDPATEKIYSEAARCLGFIRKQLDSPTSWGVHAVMAWPNLVDPMYPRLLAESRPEALIILAHYAIMLHQHRQFWVFGDLGENLIVSICRSIPAEWLAYLTEPLELLSAQIRGQVTQ